MNDIQVKEIKEAIEAADDALYHLESARGYLGSAGNWGIIDILGGGLITNLVKHSKMGKAESEVQEARYALQRFSKELRDVTEYTSIHINDFLTFADFVFDGFLTDVIVQSKIGEARRQCDEAIHRVSDIRRELTDRLNGYY
ncbi:MAG: hypothetical protein K6G22_12930 [Lachnospiraceae bacterium]|nr:hypothetical protein [Lachnospiraceae bacterium]